MQIEITENLTLMVEHRAVGRMQPSQAFDFAEQLVRHGMRQIIAEEGADLASERESSNEGRRYAD